MKSEFRFSLPGFIFEKKTKKKNQADKCNSARFHLTSGKAHHQSNMNAPQKQNF